MDEETDHKEHGETFEFGRKILHLEQGSNYMTVYN